MKPIKFLAATVLCQSILLSPMAMAKKERFGDIKKKDSQEQSQAEEKKSDSSKTKGDSSKQERAAGKGNQKARAVNDRPAPKKPAAESKREVPKKVARRQEAPAKVAKKVAKPDREKSKAQNKRPADPVRKNVEKPDKKPVAPPAKRPDPGNKAVSGNKGKGDNKPMVIPGKRPDAGKKDNPKQKVAERPTGQKGKPNPKNPVADKPAKSVRKQARPLDLPGQRPKVSDAGQTARAERVRKQENQRQAQRKVAAERQGNPNKQGRVQAERVVRPGRNNLTVKRADVRNKNTTNNNWWNTNNRVTNNNRDVRIRNTTVNNTTVINRNFERNVNWSTRRNDWGYNPWWNRPQTRPWYGSSWSGRWSNNYYHNNYHQGYHSGYSNGYRPPGYVSVGSAIGWGLVGWSLGALVYNTGYQTYQNPYPVRTEVAYRGSNYDYSQPITRVAVETAPKDAAEVEQITEKSESFIAESQSAFKERNYLVALELADKAIGESPGDGALHEYRAQILFALGKYGDAAGVLNPVLASGPGWDWSTMIALYDSQQTYTDQLQRLETYSEEHPDSADTHFLLGYHYMVCGHTDLATPQFDMAAKLMPADSVSRQLAELTSATAEPAADGEAPPPPTPPEDDADLPAPEPVPLDKLTGTWTSKREDGSTITLDFREDGKFSWSYVSDGKTTEFSGDYSMNDDGLLVLDSEDSQMVANVELPEEQQDKELKFVLAGGPPEDPGLDFTKG